METTESLTPSRTRWQNFFLIISLGILETLTPFSIDMYLPSFSAIGADLNVTAAQVAFSVSTYFIGFALGQILYGPFLDRFGRIPPMFVGILIYVLASVGCAQATTLDELLWFRFLSALGGSAASVGVLAMVRDYFPPEAGTKIFSMLMLVLSVSPLLAPTVGSLVVTTTGWRTIFWILAVLGILDILLLFTFPKGYLPNPNFSMKPGPIFQTYKEILMNRQFSVYTFTGSLAFAGLFVFIAASPAIFMEGFKVTAQEYGGIFAILAGGMIGGGQVNLLLVKKFSGPAIFKTSVYAQAFFGALLLIGNLTTGCGLAATVALIFCILVCAGIAYPNGAAMALAPFSETAGSASSLLGFLQLSIGSVLSAGIGLMQMEGSLPMAIVTMTASIIAVVILLTAGSKEKSQA